jgi:hypothetical protein
MACLLSQVNEHHIRLSRGHISTFFQGGDEVQLVQEQVFESALQRYHVCSDYQLTDLENGSSIPSLFVKLPKSRNAEFYSCSDSIRAFAWDIIFLH